MKAIIMASVVAAETRESAKTTVSLLADGKTKMGYTYNTLVEDGTYYLVGELALTDLNTLHFVDSTSADNFKSIRMSVGWRNPMEDAYDVTSFNIIYDKDNTKVEFKPEDGYAWGSIESKYYGFKWDKATKTATNDSGDQYGNYNRTIF